MFWEARFPCLSRAPKDRRNNIPRDKEAPLAKVFGGAGTFFQKGSCKKNIFTPKEVNYYDKKSASKRHTADDGAAEPGEFGASQREA